MITDTLELDDDEIEEEAEGEVDKVLHELTDGTVALRISNVLRTFGGRRCGRKRIGKNKTSNVNI
jgi:hypothetical protein